MITRLAINDYIFCLPTKAKPKLCIESWSIGLASFFNCLAKIEAIPAKKHHHDHNNFPRLHNKAKEIYAHNLWFSFMISRQEFTVYIIVSSKGIFKG